MRFPLRWSPAVRGVEVTRSSLAQRDDVAQSTPRARVAAPLAERDGLFVSSRSRGLSVVCASRCGCDTLSHESIVTYSTFSAHAMIREVREELFVWLVLDSTVGVGVDEMRRGSVSSPRDPASFRLI